MNKGIIFACGAIAGAGVTWLLLNKKYLERSNQEIEEIREFYEKKSESSKMPSVEDVKKSMFEKAPIDNYISKSDDDVAPPDGGILDDIEIISSDEFMTVNGYSKESLTYYIGDVTLADMNDEEVSLEDSIVRAEALNIVETDGEIVFENSLEKLKDVIYIRNNAIGTEYEVVLDEREYMADKGDEFYNEE